jgi:hypothetical protein
MAFDLATAKPVSAGGFDLASAKPVQPEERSGFVQGLGNLAAGAVRGAGSIGATLMTPVDLLMGNTKSIGNPERRASMDAALQTLGADPDSWMYQGGKLAGELAGTLGTGGALAAGVTRAAPAVATAAPGLINALRTGGMVTGNTSGPVVNMLTRIAGGAAGGAAGAGLIDPKTAGVGAMIGGAAPVALQGLGKAAGAVGDMVNYVKRPPETRLANKLAQSLDMRSDELRAALNQQGPQLVPGYQPTVPQILQKPVTSQLQRTLKTAGAQGLGDAERLQQAAYRETLENIAPIDISVQDAANRAGGAIESYAKPAYKEASKRVSGLFQSVDPFNESAVLLPLDDFQAASAKYLGPGTFGTGIKAARAIDTAQDVGTEVLPDVKALPVTKTVKGQNLEQAVRAAGGIRGNSGELRDLGIRQSGTTGLVNNKSGRPVDLLAEAMHQRGFIPDSDPATLLEALRNGGGRKVFASDMADNNAMMRIMEDAMGDLPGAERVAKPVPFQTVQNLRSSMGEAATQAELSGAMKESAALKEMIAALDAKMNKLAAGGGQPGEMFASDMVDTYREALGAHSAKKLQFETGPQVGMFRKGGDGQQAIQGAEIPEKFFSGRRSQVEDMQAFKRLVADNPDLIGELKRYATTEAASTGNVAGDLTSKYGKWLQSRSGANRELFNAQENMRLGAVGDNVQRGIMAENLGRVSGSDTAQKLEALNNLGLLDSKVINVLATKIPGIGAFTGPALTSLRETAAATRNNALAKLLSDPDALAEALKPGSPVANKLTELLSTRYAGQIASRAALAPALLQSDQ